MTIKRIFLSILFLILLLFILAITTVVLAIEKFPLVTNQTEFTPANIGRAKKLISANNPQKLAEGKQRTVHIIQEDLELALTYLANRVMKGAVGVELEAGSARMNATLNLPSNPLGNFLNVKLDLETLQPLPVISSLKVGKVKVPAILGLFLLRQTLNIIPGSAESLAALGMVKEFKSEKGKLTLTYEWNDKLANQFRAVVVPQDEQERWKVQHIRLVELTKQLKKKNSASLLALLQPMMQLAQSRATQGNAVDENRAVLVVLVSYLTSKNLSFMVPAAKDWPSPEKVTVTLTGRDDFPKHFIVSAAMAATADSTFSDALGLFKELADSQGGSGFSFNDMASDRAGVRFGELATLSESSARALQQTLSSSGFKEADLLPKVSDLPEYMSETDFKKRYGGVGEPEYQKMMTEIDRRIAAIPLYE